MGRITSGTGLLLRSESRLTATSRRKETRTGMVHTLSKGVVVLTGVINVAAALTLYDQEYNELAAAASKTGEPVAIERELDRGTYAARLKPSDPAQNNVRDKYSLRVRVK